MLHPSTPEILLLVPRMHRLLGLPLLASRFPPLHHQALHPRSQAWVVQSEKVFRTLSGLHIMRSHAIALLAGAAIAIGVPYAVGSTARMATQPATSSSNQVVASASHAFSQYDVPPPQVYELPVQSSSAASTSTEALTVGGYPVYGTGPSTTLPAPAHIAADVDAGVSNMNKALATAPVAMARMTESIARNGVIAALAYDDPAVKAQTDQLGQQIGASLRGFADAIAKDMQRSVRESGIQQQSVTR